MALRLVVQGVVQGVGYRETMRREAERLGVKGWVRNRLDGTVEAVIDGDEAALAAMLEWVRRGPPAARISEVFSQAHPPLDPAHQGFQRFPTK